MQKEFSKRKKSIFRDTDIVGIWSHDGRQKYTPEITTYKAVKDAILAEVPAGGAAKYSADVSGTYGTPLTIPHGLNLADPEAFCLDVWTSGTGLGANNGNRTLSNFTANSFDILYSGAPSAMDIRITVIG